MSNERAIRRTDNFVGDTTTLRISAPMTITDYANYRMQSLPPRTGHHLPPKAEWQLPIRRTENTINN